MSRVVQYTQNGDIDQLQLAEVEAPDAGPGQVRVHVRYAGLNPVDWKILGGAFGPVSGVSGNGTDFSGFVDQVGEGVEGFKPGELVYGGHPQGAQAEYLVIDDPSKTLRRVPRGLGLDTAGGLNIAGRTAIAGVRAIAPAAGETVFVSGASGGVGIIAAQLATHLGARVIGSASPANHRVLRSLGIEPVSYGDGLADRLRELAPGGIDAAFSTRDATEIEFLLELGIAAGRINAIGAGPQAGASYGVHVDGTAKASGEDLDWLAQAIAYGHLHLPVSRVFALDEVQEAYRYLTGGHPVGKLLLRLDDTRLNADHLRTLGA